MGKKDKKDNTRGKEGFDLYYRTFFGERWEKLKESLLKETEPSSFCLEKINKSDSTLEPEKNLRTYFLDSASILAAFSLPLKSAHDILDLCAAPGGKTLVISSLMNDDAVLTSNERSFERKQRLVKVCDEHLPQNIRNRVTITCSDGAVWCKTKQDCFDAILLDAPCSSERHVLNDEKYLSEWSPARIKTLSMEQWALLSSAFRMLREDGVMIYSTCALSPKENDEVVSRLFKKFENVKVLRLDDEEYRQNSNDIEKLKLFTGAVLPGTEQTEFGYQILPDIQNGSGPIYFSIIKKTRQMTN